MCHNQAIRYSKRIGIRGQPRLFYQREVWQRSLEKVPAGRDVLYNSDMVTVTALLSQQIGKTVAYTSIKAGFMIPPPLFYSPHLSPPLIASMCVQVCARTSLRDNYWDVLLKLSLIDELDGSLDTLCWCMALALSFFSHLYSSSARHRTPGIIRRESGLNKKSSAPQVSCHSFLCLYVLSSLLLFLFICHSAKGPKPPVATGGVEPWLHPAGLRRQHWHRASLRPHGQRTLCHPTGNHASLSSLTSSNNPLFSSKLSLWLAFFSFFFFCIDINYKWSDAAYGNPAFAWLLFSIISIFSSDDWFTYNMLYLIWINVRIFLNFSLESTVRRITSQLNAIFLS